jgi:YVTN family beta-propeller protein
VPLPFAKLPVPLAALLLLALAACKSTGLPVYPDGYREFAYVANTASNSVTVLDLVFLRQDRTLAVGQAPSALAVNPTLDEVYVVNSQPAAPSGSVSVIDTLKNEVVATIPVHRDPTAIAVDPTGTRAFVANAASNTVSVLDLKTRRILASLPTGGHPTGVAIAPDGRSVAVTNQQSGTVSLYQSTTSTDKPLTPRATFSGCPGATSPVILPDSSKLFVACSTGHQVMAISLAAAPDSWPAKQDPALTSDHLLDVLDVGQQPTHLAVKPDGGEIFATSLASNSVSEISTQTNEVGSTYPIGDRPTHGIVGKDNSALWVAASGDDSISLYSIDDGKFVSSLRTGIAPDALAFSADQNLLLAADFRSGDVAVIRTVSKLGPALLTILPAGGNPSAIVVKAMPNKP